MWTRRLITILAIAALPASAEAQLGTVLREAGQLLFKSIPDLIGSLRQTANPRLIRAIDPPEPTKIPLDQIVQSLRQLPPDHRSELLSGLSPEQRGQFLSQLSPEQKDQVLSGLSREQRGPSARRAVPNAEALHSVARPEDAATSRHQLQA